jgi:predicted transcriptional regulator
MGINIAGLKQRIKDADMNLESFAAAVGIDRATLYRKMNAGGVKFTIQEIQRIITVLKISKAEAAEIFFTNVVA